jgi:nicotinate-nucleotide adenylyltransferase
MRARRVIVFGGSFNPVHSGHVLLARAAREALGADEVLFVPCARSAYGKRLWPAPLRWDLLKAALRGQAGMRASAIELRRGGLSRSIDTLRELRRRRPADRFFLLLGGDQAPRVSAWKAWPELRQLAEVVFVRRPQTGFLGKKIKATVLNVPQYEISSSVIRKRLKEKKDISLLVPPAVHVKLLKIQGKIL